MLVAGVIYFLAQVHINHQPVLTSWDFIAVLKDNNKHRELH
jgi:hypothetical protein